MQAKLASGARGGAWRTARLHGQLLILGPRGRGTPFGRVAVEQPCGVPRLGHERERIAR